MLLDREIAIGLGANLGTETDRVARFDAAIERLVESLATGAPAGIDVGNSVRRSVLGPPRRAPLYRTAPMGPYRSQPAFLNTAVVLELSWPLPEPEQVMGALLAVEALFGRDRRAETPQGPRTLDLDLLAWGRRRIERSGPPEVVVPHPRLAERRFALAPLRSVVGGAYRIPGVASTVDECLQRLDDQGVKPVGL